MRPLVACVLALVDCGSVPAVPSVDAAIEDAGGDAACLVHFDQTMSCGDAALSGPCGDAPKTTIHSDAGFAIGCTTTQDDERYFDRDAGACVTPEYTCVADPTPHWEPSLVNAGLP